MFWNFNDAAASYSQIKLKTGCESKKNVGKQ